MKKLIAIVSALVALVVAPLLAGCSTEYSVETKGGPSVYGVGDTLPNDGGSAVVTVYRTGYAVDVTARVPSSASFPGTPGDEASSPSITAGPFTDWSGRSMEPQPKGDGTFALDDAMKYLSDDQRAALQCVLKAEQPFTITFEAANHDDRYAVEVAGEFMPSRDENNLGTVINPDCSVTVLEEASVSAVYLVEVNTVD